MTQKLCPVLGWSLRFHVPSTAYYSLESKQALQSVSLGSSYPPCPPSGIQHDHCLWSCSCEVIIVASPLEGTSLNLLFIFWTTAILLKTKLSEGERKKIRIDSVHLCYRLQRHGSVVQPHAANPWSSSTAAGLGYQHSLCSQGEFVSGVLCVPSHLQQRFP